MRFFQTDIDEHVFFNSLVCKFGKKNSTRLSGIASESIVTQSKPPDCLELEKVLLFSLLLAAAAFSVG